jgi:FkbM family methyltransferase
LILKDIEQTIIDLMVKNNLKNYYDIGANPTVKTIILFEELLKNDINIFAFEPHPFGFTRLDATFYNSIKSFNVGIGNKDESKILYSKKTDTCLSSFSLDFMHKKTSLTEFDEYECKIRRLDSFIDEHDLPEVDIIKIDSEDWESQVIESIPLESEPIILVEYHSKRVRLEVEDLLRYKYDQNIFFNYGTRNIVRYFVYTSVNRAYTF